MDYDVVIVGAGHNGLTAAAYLARAGLSVQVLERLEHTGGAAVSAQAFPGLPTRLSRYSYLVSLMPEQLVTELGLDVRLSSRATASYTPTLRNGKPGGLYVEHDEGEATRRSFLELTGSEEDYEAWREFYADVAELAAVVAPTLLEPLPHRARDHRARGPGHLARPGRPAARRGRRAALRRRHRARRGRHRRADRHLRLAARPVAHPEPLLPLPPDRQRHRRVAGAGRRDGCGHHRPAPRGRRGRCGDRHRGRGERDPHRRGRRDGRGSRCRCGGRLARRRAAADVVRAPRAGQRGALGARHPARRTRGPRQPSRRAPSSRSTCCSTGSRG